MRLGWGVLFLSIMLGCGGTIKMIGFRNHTSATDEQLWAMWRQAQQDLASNEVMLNPVQALFKHEQPICGITVECVPPDTKALQDEPDGVAVYEVPDQGGSIPCGPHRCYAYTLGGEVYVDSLYVLNQGATGWEFQNIMLARDGIPTDGR